MALLLSIETATEVCSVVLSNDSEIIAIRESAGTNEHSALLTVYIEELFRETGLQRNELDAIAVSMGPGSYTGLRIGVSVAKGLCFALDKPMIAVDTLQAMALQAIKTFGGMGLNEPEILLVPMIDARRMEVYTAVFDQQLNTLAAVDAVIMKNDTFSRFEGKKLALFGNGAEKCREILSGNPGILFPGILLPSAAAIASLAAEKFMGAEFVDTAYSEPFYLKDFIAGKPNVKGLRS